MGIGACGGQDQAYYQLMIAAVSVQSIIPQGLSRSSGHLRVTTVALSSYETPGSRTGKLVNATDLLP